MYPIVHRIAYHTFYCTTIQVPLYSHKMADFIDTSPCCWLKQIIKNILLMIKQKQFGGQTNHIQLARELHSAAASFDEGCKVGTPSWTPSLDVWKPWENGDSIGKPWENHGIFCWYWGAEKLASGRTWLLSEFAGGGPHTRFKVVVVSNKGPGMDDSF